MQNGRLVFPNQESVTNYIELTDSLQSQWEMPQSLTLMQETVDGNIYDALDAIEGSLGFVSLRSDYERLSEDNINFASTLSFFVKDPDTRRIFNSNAEVVVADTLYKQLPSDIVAVITGNESEKNAAVQQIKQKSSRAVAYNISYLNEQTGNLMPKSLEETASSSSAFCGYIDVKEIRGNSDSRIVSLDIQPFTNGGDACLPVLSIEWGDGTKTISRQRFENHTYNLAKGDCKLYNVKVTLHGNANCNGCNIVDPGTINVTPCNALCKTDYEIMERYTEFDYNGTKYRLIANIGQRTKTKSFEPNRKFWADIVLKYYSVKAKKWYDAHAEGMIGANIDGRYYTNGCSSPSQTFGFGQKSQITATQNKGNCLALKYETREDFATRKDELVASAYVYMDANFSYVQTLRMPFINF